MTFPPRVQNALDELDSAQESVAIELRRADRLRREVRALLSEVAAAGVALDDPRLDYVEVQIDRPTWEALGAYEEDDAHERP